MDSGLLNSKEASDFLRVSPSMLIALRKHHGLPHIRLGRKVMFSRDALVAYLASHSVTQS
jgi:excisionase family DNA binding protein